MKTIYQKINPIIKLDFFKSTRSKRNLVIDSLSENSSGRPKQNDERVTNCDSDSFIISNVVKVEYLRYSNMATIE